MNSQGTSSSAARPSQGSASEDVAAPPPHSMPDTDAEKVDLLFAAKHALDDENNNRPQELSLSEVNEEELSKYTEFKRAEHENARRNSKMPPPPPRRILPNPMLPKIEESREMHHGEIDGKPPRRVSFEGDDKMAPKEAPADATTAVAATTPPVPGIPAPATPGPLEEQPGFQSMPRHGGDPQFMLNVIENNRGMIMGEPSDEDRSGVTDEVDEFRQMLYNGQGNSAEDTPTEEEDIDGDYEDGVVIIEEEPPGGKDTGSVDQEDEERFFLCLAVVCFIILVVFVIVLTVGSDLISSDRPDMFSSLAPSTMPPIGRPVGPTLNNPTPQIPSIPTVTPTLVQTNRPTPVPVCFGSNEELKSAVADYIDDNSELSQVAQAYGWPIGSWCVSGLEDLSGIFLNRALFNEDISNWDVSRAVTMRGMFYGASAFNQPLDQWNISSVTDMSNMFRRAASFNQDLNGPLWDTGQVTTMERMFQAATAFNGAVETWDTSNVENMYGMFWSSSFNRDASSWDTSKVINLVNVFRENPSFNQDLCGWDTSRANELAGMFQGASSFNQDLSCWDVTAAIDLSYMFHSAQSFQRDLCSWGGVVASGASVSYMFWQTNCPEVSDPVLSSDNPGPFCFSC